MTAEIWLNLCNDPKNGFIVLYTLFVIFCAIWCFRIGKYDK